MSMIAVLRYSKFESITVNSILAREHAAVIKTKELKQTMLKQVWIKVPSQIELSYIMQVLSENTVRCVDIIKVRKEFRLPTRKPEVIVIDTKRHISA